MGKADGLSRRSDWEKGAEGDNENRTLLKPVVDKESTSRRSNS